VITGPSGVGKGTLISRLREAVPGLDLSVSATTRAPRAGERPGVHYHFMDTTEFDRHVAAADFLEHADYASHRYGTLRSEVEPRLARGESVVLEIELQGARQVRAAMPDAVQVFIAPPSPQALRERLEGRGTDGEEEIERRLAVAEQELAARDEFGHVIVNDDVDSAAAELTALVRAALDGDPPNDAAPPINGDPAA
jgi:guanylate kinase